MTLQEFKHRHRGDKVKSIVAKAEAAISVALAWWLLLKLFF